VRTGALARAGGALAVDERVARCAGQGPGSRCETQGPRRCGRDRAARRGLGSPSPVGSRRAHHCLRGHRFRGGGRMEPRATSAAARGAGGHRGELCIDGGRQGHAVVRATGAGVAAGPGGRVPRCRRARRVGCRAARPVALVPRGATNGAAVAGRRADPGGRGRAGQGGGGGRGPGLGVGLSRCGGARDADASAPGGSRGVARGSGRGGASGQPPAGGALRRGPGVDPCSARARRGATSSRPGAWRRQ
jgi:hypothetical protein